MYVTRSRYSAPYGACFYRSTKSGYELERAVYPVLSGTQTVYSWRTGKSAYNKPFPRQNIQEVFKPSGATLVDKIRSRQQFISDQWANAAGSLLSQEDYDPGARVSLTDDGHSFWSLRYRVSGRAKVVQSSTEWDGRSEKTWSDALVALPMVNPAGPWGPQNFSNEMAPGFPSVLPPSATQIAATSVDLFNSARPDKSVSGIGETIVEILSGNVPRLVNRLGKNIASGRIFTQRLRSSGADVGDAFLWSAFAWQPIINDMTKLIELALQATDLMYGDEFRRHRVSPTRWLSSDGQVYDHTVTSLAGEGLPYAGLININTHFKHDTHLSAKFSKAKPTIGTKSFLDRAADALELMGVWTPSLGWDVLPYSWLVDWFIHIGKGLENVSTYSTGSGTYHTNFAYATTKTVAVVTAAPYKSRRGNDRSYVETQTVSSSTSVTTTLQRTRATPFGFGTTFKGLSSNQWNILVALGLAKSR